MKLTFEEKRALAERQATEASHILICLNGPSADVYYFSEVTKDDLSWILKHPYFMNFRVIKDRDGTFDGLIKNVDPINRDKFWSPKRVSHGQE